MGVVSHGDLVSNKFLTAFVQTGGGHSKVVHIKKWLTPTIWTCMFASGLYMFFEPGGADGAGTYRVKGQKGRVSFYDMRRALPYDPREADLVDLLKVAGAVRVDMAMVHALRRMRTNDSDKKGWKGHDLKLLIRGLEQADAGGNVVAVADGALAMRLRNWVSQIQADIIPRKVGGVSKYLDETIDPSPELVDNLIDSTTEEIVKKNTNKPMTPARTWLKIMLIAVGVFAVGLYVDHRAELAGWKGDSTITLEADPCSDRLLSAAGLDEMDIAVQMQTGELDCTLVDLSPSLRTLVHSLDPELVQVFVEERRAAMPEAAP